MKITPRIKAVFIGAALLAVLVAVFSFWAFSEIEKAASARAQTDQLLDDATSLLSELKDAETGARGYVLTGQENFLQPYQAVHNQLNGKLQSLRSATVNPEARIQLDALVPLLQSRLAELTQIVELRRNGDVRTATAQISGGEGKRLMDSLRTGISLFVQTEKGQLAENQAGFESSMRLLFTVIVAASQLTLLFAAAFAYLLYLESQQRVADEVNIKTRQLLETQEELNRQLQETNTTLQVSEEKLAVTLNSIGDAVIATDNEGHVTLMNPLAELLTGWSQSDAKGRAVDEVFHIIDQQTREPSVVPVLRALANGTTQGLANHTLLIARSGSECAIADSCAPIRGRDNRVVGSVLVFRDVTDEDAARKAARDGAALIQTVLNTVTDGIITLQAGGGIVERANLAAERMFGYPAAGLLGREFSLLIPELEHDQNHGSLDDYGANSDTHADGIGREVAGRRQDGSLFPLEIAVSEMWLGNKRFFTAILRDISARKQSEAALLKSGALQNAIFNSANFSSIATDEKGVIQIFNVGAERMLGYAAADVMNKITPADISDPQEVIARAAALSDELSLPIKPGFEALVFKASRGIEDIYELTYIRKDGSRFPAIVSVTALRDAQDGIIGYLLIGTDNTARKQAEDALLKAGALQSAIFNSANFSSIATDEKGVIQIFNVGAERMLGYAAADVMNKITPADISDPEEVIARAMALSTELSMPITPGFEALVFKASRGIEDIYELTYIRKDGSRFPAIVSVTALRDAQDEIIGYLLIGTDNTARKQVEAEQMKLDQRLRDQQFYSRSLIESNIDAIMTTDPSGIITDVNKQTESLTGCTRDELIGAPFKNYFTDPQRAAAGIKRVLSEMKVTDYELTARHRDGRETVVSYNANTYYDRDRRLQGVFAAARDVTERKRLDLALQDTNVELKNAMYVAEKANLAKSDFLSSMSHELRSPLNAILGFAQLLDTDQPPATPSQKASIDQILHAGWYLLELINEILDLAVIESGRLSLSEEPVALDEVMLECQAMIEPQGQRRGLTMTFPRFDVPCFVRADRTRLKQVLINLLSNAIKYNRPDGAVTVTCAATSPTRTRISIRDTGAGLAPEKLLQLFQPFNRLGQENSAEEGTGIGLVMSKRVVELMGGVIGVDSKVGTGSVFWFELSAVAAPEHAVDLTATASAAPTLPAPDPLVRSLLYVEDNPANLKLVEKLISRRTDLHLLTAVNADIGIQLARTKQPVVILMDINLPGISGIQALKILREDPLTAHIPVLAISANAMPNDIKKGLDAGFARYLTKPIKVDEFMAALDAALTVA